MFFYCAKADVRSPLDGIGSCMCMTAAGRKKKDEAALKKMPATSFM
jgi:hypothetical protein